MPAFLPIDSGKNFFKRDLLNRWLLFAGVNAKSAKTYKIALNQLANFFRANAIEKPARFDLEKWRDALIAEKKSPATIRLYLTATKIFFRWLAQENLYPNISDNIKSGVKVSHEHKKDALTAAQANKIIMGVEGNSLKSKRDRAILALMMTAGLRCVEVARLDVADIVNQFGRTFLLIQGKGHCAKDAKVLLPAQVENLIQEYLTARGKVENSQPLFSSCAFRSLGLRLSAQAISKMVKARLRAAGFDSPRLTAHSLRHTAFTTMLLAGCSLESVQMCARHVNISTTQIYNHSVERLKNTAEQIAANAIFDTISA